MLAEYDDDGNYKYPEGFDPEANQWKEGFEEEKARWEQGYAVARDVWHAHTVFVSEFQKNWRLCLFQMHPRPCHPLNLYLR